MENKTLNLFGNVFAVILLCAVAANGYALWLAVKEIAGTFQYFQISIRLLTCGFGAWYLFLGCRKKGGAVLFKLFLCLFCWSQLMQLLVTQLVAVKIFIGIKIAALAVLMCVRDLGEKRSKVCAAVVVLFALLTLVIVLAQGEFDLSFFVGFISCLLNAVAIYLLVCGKYADKKARGTV